MASIKTKLFVGIFVIIGFFIAFAAVLWLGTSGHLEKGQFYQAYFDESVQGLDKDSPVKYRGVSIGRVESIGVAPDSNLIQVILKIESGLKPDENTVAQLKSVGITGIMFVELDRRKETDIPFRPDNLPSKYPVIATKPSEIKKLFSSIDDIFSQIKKLDLEVISDKTKLTLDRINHAVEDAQIRAISSDIRTSLGRVEEIMDAVERTGSSLNKLTRNADQAVGSINRIIAENEKTFSKAITDFDVSMVNAKKIMEKGAALIDNTNTDISILQRHLLISLKHIEKASESLNWFVDLIADNPARLVFGEPPPARQIEPEK